LARAMLTDLAVSGALSETTLLGTPARLASSTSLEHDHVVVYSVARGHGGGMRLSTALGMDLGDR
jgi:hypothetical protein